MVGIWGRERPSVNMIWEVQWCDHGGSTGRIKRRLIHRDHKEPQGGVERNNKALVLAVRPQERPCALSLFLHLLLSPGNRA